MQEISKGEEMVYELFLQKFIGNHWVNKVVQDGVPLQECIAQLKVSEISNGELLCFETNPDSTRMNITAIIDPKRATFFFNSKNKTLIVSINDAQEGNLKELCFVFEREPDEA